MAAIDKIYGTDEQYLELKEFISVNIPQSLNELFKPEDVNTFDDETRPIGRLSLFTEQYILLKSDLEWAKEKILYAYNFKNVEQWCKWFESRIN